MKEEYPEALNVAKISEPCVKHADIHKNNLH